MHTKIKICLYSHIENKKLFKTVGFYRDDILALGGDNRLIFPTNSIFEILKLKPYMVVSYFYSWSVFVSLLGRLLGFRVILTGGADQISPYVNSGISLLIRKFTALLCLIFSEKIQVSCLSDKKAFHSLCLGIGFLKDKVYLAPHVVRAPCNFEDRKTSVDKFKAFTLCWLGSEENINRKGVDKSIELIFLLRALGVDATLNIAGADGKGRGYLEEVIKKYKMSKYVKYLGVISDDKKNKMMCNHNVYLQLSKYEGFGVAAAEAHFSGMIVIHSNIGGLKDVIGDNGIIVDREKIHVRDLSYAEKIYLDFVNYKVNREYILSEVKKYSLAKRSAAFFVKSV